MKWLHYIEITNFKKFTDKQRIELNHPSVLIGPNNCGKTTVLQAIGLWHQSIQLWHKEKAAGSPKTQTETQIRLPQPGTRLRAQHLWNNAIMHKDDHDVPIIITVGLNYKNEIMPVTIRFYDGGQSWLTSDLDSAVHENPEILTAANNFNMAMIHPMSQLNTTEDALTHDSIEELIMKGQAGQVLRNLCFHMHRNTPDVWKEIVDRMRYCFAIKLHSPTQNSQKKIELVYEENETTLPLNISFAGRGLQQILLTLVYLYSYNRSVFLVDEPDTHLEILRQRQIYTLLQHVAAKTESQVVMTTHSETLIDEGLRQGTLSLLIEGKIQKLPSRKTIFKKQRIVAALKYAGSQQYILACQYGHVLYLEGSSDFHILAALARKRCHPVTQYLNAPVNINYVSGNFSKHSAKSELERIDGVSGITPEKHFECLKELVPGIRGLVILDSDGKKQKDTKDRLPIVFWKRYEIENYFITRELLIKSIEHHYKKCPQFDRYKKTASKTLNGLIKERIFNADQNNFDTWNDASPEKQQQQWEEKTKNCKLSALAKDFYKRFARATEEQVLYIKREFCQLIEFVEPETIPEEVTEKLDLLQNLLKNSGPQK